MAADMDIPAHFDRPYTGPIIEMIQPHETVQILCKAAGKQPWEVFYGCSWKKGETCYIVMSSTDKAVRRHEMAHCNGWKHG